MNFINILYAPTFVIKLIFTDIKTTKILLINSFPFLLCACTMDNPKDLVGTWKGISHAEFNDKDASLSKRLNFNEDKSFTEEIEWSVSFLYQGHHYTQNGTSDIKGQWELNLDYDIKSLNINDVSSDSPEGHAVSAIYGDIVMDMNVNRQFEPMVQEYYSMINNEPFDYKLNKRKTKLHIDIEDGINLTKVK